MLLRTFCGQFASFLTNVFAFRTSMEDHVTQNFLCPIDDVRVGGAAGRSARQIFALKLEHQTNLRDDFTIAERIPSRGIFALVFRRLLSIVS